MRWLIVGPYPPEQGSGPAAAAAMAAECLTHGDTVHAVSPRPTAAHAHMPLGGVRAMWALAEVARQQRSGGLWLRIEPGILLSAGTDRRRTLTDRLALAALLRRFKTSILDVGDVGLLPGGRAGKPVFASATTFVTHSDKDTATLLANGVPGSKLEQVDLGSTSSTATGTTVQSVISGPVDYPPPSTVMNLTGDRAAIEAAVRTRAAELAAARAAAVTP